MPNKDYDFRDKESGTAAFVSEPTASPTMRILTDIFSPFWLGGTFATTTSMTNIVSFNFNSNVLIHSISIAPLSNTYSVSFFIQLGNFNIGSRINPLVLNGFGFQRDWSGNSSRYPLMSIGDVLVIGALSSGAGFVTIDIDGEFM